MVKTKLLVVDDHAVMRDGIRAIIRNCEDLEIIGEAADGMEAVEKAFNLLPDLIIMDLSMPKMDGLEALRQIKKKRPFIKTLILTQYDCEEMIISAVKAGAYGYLPKMAIGAELISAIHSIQRGNAFLSPPIAKVVIDTYQKPASINHYDSLSKREREIFKLVAEGNTSRKIAGILCLSTKTVLGHRNNLMHKLKLHNRTELVKYAMRKKAI